MNNEQVTNAFGRMLALLEPEYERWLTLFSPDKGNAINVLTGIIYEATAARDYLEGSNDS